MLSRGDSPRQGASTSSPPPALGPQSAQRLGAIDVAVFRNDLLVPRFAVARNSGEVIGSKYRVPVRWMNCWPVAVHDGEVERLGVDVELMAAELDHAGAAREELLAVLELADGFLAEDFRRVEKVVGLHRIAELEQLLDGLAHLRDHHIGGEVGVDFLRRT